ncbi:hypothetical protein POTOM_052584 [Populus tomentosa]|uniref:DC1 domain-containing protein n=1 Tax=Populus tomentosa TaxID=118781 RepID=A0A8X7Y4G8_POPTO|nr:hypothetical protein POTOM_052584 [Populus tomentosa]
MPRKTRHPAHPDHYLTLLVSPPLDNSNFKCEACGDHITGFCYNVTESNIYCHILCSVLPISGITYSHPHALKIEFSLPYDFSCDLCKNPSSKGWLYRCSFCEFDTHIACVISNKKAEPVPLLDTLTRQIMDADRKIDYGSQNLLKSYPSAGHHPYSTNMEASYIKDVPKVEAKIKSDNVAMPQGVQQHRYPNMPVTNHLYRGPSNWYNESFLGQTGEKIIATGYESRAGIKDLKVQGIHVAGSFFLASIVQDMRNVLKVSRMEAYENQCEWRSTHMQPAQLMNGEALAASNLCAANSSH